MKIYFYFINLFYNKNIKKEKKYIESDWGWYIFIDN